MNLDIFLTNIMAILGTRHSGIAVSHPGLCLLGQFLLQLE